MPTPLEALPAPQRFMYDYGCFLVFWGSFELMLEVAIGARTGRLPKQNAHALARKMAGEKKGLLLELLEKEKNAEGISALNEVFDIAERNFWVHGTVLNPKGDFSVLTLLRVEKKEKTLHVSNTPIELLNPPFKRFYKAFERFEVAVGQSEATCNAYIIALQQREV
jgi:hypothetical protein